MSYFGPKSEERRMATQSHSYNWCCCHSGVCGPSGLVNLPDSAIEAAGRYALSVGRVCAGSSALLTLPTVMGHWNIVLFRYVFWPRLRRA